MVERVEAKRRMPEAGKRMMECGWWKLEVDDERRTDEAERRMVQGGR